MWQKILICVEFYIQHATYIFTNVDKAKLITHQWATVTFNILIHHDDYSFIPLLLRRATMVGFFDGVYPHHDLRHWRVDTRKSMNYGYSYKTSLLQNANSGRNAQIFRLGYREHLIGAEIGPACEKVDVGICNRWTWTLIQRYQRWLFQGM